MLSLPLFALVACSATVSAMPTEKRFLGLGGPLVHVLADLAQPFNLRQAGPARCDLTQAQMPAAPTPLPPPTAGLSLVHVAIGRGTQNYTCDTTNATAVPAAIGAVATLYNVSCIASDAPALLNRLSDIALALPLPASTSDNGPVGLAVSGHHFFTDNTTPFFDLDTPRGQYGEGAFKKSAATPAPANAMIGPNKQGSGAVPWLKLVAKVPGQSLKEVYRLRTAGGSAPATCAGQPASFQVQYAAEYWFWA